MYYKRGPILIFLLCLLFFNKQVIAQSTNALDLIIDYDGPSLSTTHKTITLSEYYNEEYARLNVSRVEEGYNTSPQGDPKYTATFVKLYDAKGYITAHTEYQSEHYMETALGTVLKPIQRSYTYSADRHQINEVSYIKLGKRIDTVYVDQLFFDDQDRLVKRYTKSHSTDYAREFLYEYDTLNNCIKESWGLGNTFSSINYEYEYDKTGNLLREVPNGNTLYARNFLYDSLGRLAHIESSTDSLKLSYDEASNVSSIQFYKGLRKGEADLMRFGLNCERGVYSFVYDDTSRITARDFYCFDQSSYIVSRSQVPLTLKYFYFDNGLISEVNQIQTVREALPNGEGVKPYFNYSYSYKYRNQD